MTVRIDDLRHSGSGDDENPATVLTGADAEQLRMLVMLADGPLILNASCV